MACMASCLILHMQAQVVYLPSCVTRMMGPAASDPEKASVHEKLLSVFNKAGYEVHLPRGVFTRCIILHFVHAPTCPAARHGGHVCCIYTTNAVRQAGDALPNAASFGVFPIYACCLTNTLKCAKVSA